MDGRAPDSNWVNNVAPVLDVIDNGSGKTTIIGTGPTNSSSSVVLSGANQGSGALPAPLKPYDGILFWQDRRNSMIKYNPDGSYNCAAPFTGVSCAKTSAQQAADLMIDNFESLEQEIDALTGTITLDGVIYQPRAV